MTEPPVSGRSLERSALNINPGGWSVLAYNLRQIISLYGSQGAMNALRWAAA